MRASFCSDCIFSLWRIHTIIPAAIRIITSPTNVCSPVLHVLYTEETLFLSEDIELLREHLIVRTTLSMLSAGCFLKLVGEVMTAVIVNGNVYDSVGGSCESVYDHRLAI